MTEHARPPVGDLNSTEPGSGARFNQGKPALELIPVRMWLERWAPRMREENLRMLFLVLSDLRDFQEGDDFALEKSWANLGADTVRATVAVLEFGATKYHAWNWAKGMPWSVCIGCILRHAEQIIEGCQADPESGVHPMGHIGANLMFLRWYVEHYRAGDDRPPTARPKVVIDERWVNE